MKYVFIYKLIKKLMTKPGVGFLVKKYWGKFMFVCNNLCIGNVVYATEKFQGDGTKSSPYLIQDINDMNKLAMNVNSGNNYEGVYFLLTNDLIYDNTSNNYTPIGKNGSVLEGNFDGNFSKR